MHDFLTALDEINPLFGLDSSGMLENKVKGGIYEYGPSPFEESKNDDELITKTIDNSKI